MRRTTVFLEEDLQRELSALARQQARPAAALVREAIGQYVASRKASSPRVLTFVGVGGSGRSDTAETHEELLFTNLELHSERGAGPDLTSKSAARKTRARSRNARGSSRRR
jgi:hypothetical protein